MTVADYIAGGITLLLLLAAIVSRMIEAFKDPRR